MRSKSFALQHLEQITKGRLQHSCLSHHSVAAYGGGFLARIIASGIGLAIALPASCPLAVAQSNDQMVNFAGRSAIVVLGTVTKVAASEEPLLAPSNATVVIKIEQMFAGSEFAGDQTGHPATVILSKPGDMKVGSKALF
jgi:hypothetical protein